MIGDRRRTKMVLHFIPSPATTSISSSFFCWNNKSRYIFCRDKTFLWFCWLGLTAVVVVLAAAKSSSAASPQQRPNNNYNYNPYQYDLTIPQFTPDGRLLQVEYAQKASTDHSIPIIVATTTTTSMTTDNTKGTVENEQITILIACHRSRTGQQSRLIVLPSKLSTTTTTTRDEDDDDHDVVTGGMMVLAISGIISDALAILQIIQSFRIQEYRTMGGGGGSDNAFDDEHRCRRIAYQIAAQCQSRTMTGGKRPYGATIWIMTTSKTKRRVSLPNSSGTNRVDSPVFHQIDPSGAIYDIQLPLSAVTILGGGGLIGTKIQHRLQNDWVQVDPISNDGTVFDATGTTTPSSEITIQRRIGNLLSIAMEEYQSHYLNKNNHDSNNGSNHSSNNDTMDTDDSTANKMSTNDPLLKEVEVHHDTTTIIMYDHLEVVLVSSKRGPIKLTSHQIHKFCKRTGTINRNSKTTTIL